MTPHWTDWLPAAMTGHYTEDHLLPLLNTLTPEALGDTEVVDLWHWLYAQLPSIPGIDAFPQRLDTCGTGGSGLYHFNTSTTVALLLASMGIPVTKFGNRAATSQSGSFDFLAELGLGQPLPLEAISNQLSATNLAFIYAPQCIPGLKHLASARKQLGQKTVFNLLGPLLNPCRPTHQLLGTSQYYPWMRQILREQHVNAWLVTGHAGQDDVTPWGSTTIYPSHKPSFTFQGQVPLPKASDPDTAAHNITTFWAIVNGQDNISPAYHLVCTNTAAALSLWHSDDKPLTHLSAVQNYLASGAAAIHTKMIQTLHEKLVA